MIASRPADARPCPQPGCKGTLIECHLCAVGDWHCTVMPVTHEWTTRELDRLQAELDKEPDIGIVAWTEANYPGGYAINGAGQRIPAPVYDDPESQHLYPRCPHGEQVGNCGECAESDIGEAQGDDARDGAL